MNFETIDWEAEAKRVAAAFGVKRNCSFQPCSAPFSKALCENRRLFQNNRMFDSRLELDVIYTHYYRSIELRQPKSKRKGIECASIVLNWDGSVESADSNTILTLPLAKGLFHLDLLTSEVEIALQVGISAHQKVEWALEFAARQNL